MAETVETAVYRLRVEGQEQVDRATRSVEGLATAEDKLASANRNTSATIQRGIAQLDPLIAAQERYLRSLRSIENARERGTASESQLAARLALEKKAYNDATIAAEHYRRAQANAQLTPFKRAEDSAFVLMRGEDKSLQQSVQHMNQLGSATKLTRYEWINLSRQIQDVGVSLFSGQSPLTVMVQQGSQIADVFASSKVSARDAFGQMAEGAMRFITPMNAAIAAVAAGTVATLALANAWDKVNVSSQRAISGAGARTGTTVSDINAFVNKNTPSSFTGAGLSQNESRALAEGLTQTGDIVISKLHDMSDAVVGFSNQTKKSMDEAVKAFIEFGKDPRKAMDQLADAFGPLGDKTRDLVDYYLRLGDKTSAFNVLLDATAQKALEAAQNMGVLEKAGRGVTNALQTRLAPTGLETQLEKARQELDAMIASAEKWKAVGRDAPVEVSKGIEILSRKFEELQARQQAVRDTAAADVLKNIEDKARAATDALIPQNEQLKIMETRLNELKAAQGAGVGGPDLQAAITAQENMIAKTREAKEEAGRYNERVKEISKSWGDVGQSTALQLQTMQNNLPVAEAVGGAAKMAAQYTADYKNAMDQGKTATEATALAAANLAKSEAEVNAAALETLWNLKNQLPVIEAIGGAAKMLAQQQATYNQLIHDGVRSDIARAVAAQELKNAMAQINAQAKQTLWDLQNQAAAAKAVTAAEQMAAAAAATYNKMVHEGVAANIAAAVAAQQKANAEAQATANVYRQVEALKDSAAMIQAQTRDLGTNSKHNEAATAAAIAYKNAKESGASIDAAIAIKNETIANYAARAAQEAEQFRIELEKAAVAAAMAEVALENTARAAKTAADLAYVMKNGVFAPNVMPTGQLQFTADARYPVSYSGGGTGKRLSVDDSYLNPERANASIYKYLNGEPNPSYVDPATNKLTDSIDELKDSTDRLTKSNEDLLSPYYTQDPRTSHIGFRSQGMAGGGYVDVPGGASANDNMLAMIPVASGERIFVDPMTNKRGMGGGMVINISSPITINGNANADQLGRTLYQSNQALAKQVRTATQ